MPALRPAHQERIVLATVAGLRTRYLHEIPEMHALGEDVLTADVDAVVAWHSDLVLSAIGESHDPDPAIFRNSTIRRIDQGLPLQAALRAYEVWAEELWHQATAPGVRADLGTGQSLALATLVTRHVEAAHAAITRLYLDAGTGRSVAWERLRPDLLRALLSADDATPFVQRLAVSLRLDRETAYCVLLVRPRARDVGTSANLRRALHATTRILDRARCTVPASGIDGFDVAAIVAAPHEGLRAVRESADAIAHELPDFVVGLSRARRTDGGFAAAYREAHDAITYASTRGEPRAFGPLEAVLNRALRESADADRIRQATLEPLEAYDRDHDAELLLTLQTYADCDLRLSSTAARLHVQPNTVRYRLRRIHEITGHDPLTTHGIVVLVSGLRLVAPSA